jgi:hypothetical protein
LQLNDSLPNAANDSNLLVPHDFSTESGKKVILPQFPTVDSLSSYIPIPGTSNGATAHIQKFETLPIQASENSVYMMKCITPPSNPSGGVSNSCAALDRGMQNDALNLSSQHDCLPLEEKKLLEQFDAAELDCKDDTQLQELQVLPLVAVPIVEPSNLRVDMETSNNNCSRMDIAAIDERVLRLGLKECQFLHREILKKRHAMPARKKNGVLKSWLGNRLREGLPARFRNRKSVKTFFAEAIAIGIVTESGYGAYKELRRGPRFLNL